MLAALSAAFWFDFFFTVPFNSPPSPAREDALSAAAPPGRRASSSGQLSVWARRQADAARQGRADIGRIHRAADLASRGESADRVVAAVAAQLREVLDLRDCRFDPGPADPLLARIDPNGEVWWGELAWGTDSLGLPAKGVTLEVSGGGRVLGAYTLIPTPGELDRARPAGGGGGPGPPGRCRAERLPDRLTPVSGHRDRPRDDKAATRGQGHSLSPR